MGRRKSILAVSGSVNMRQNEELFRMPRKNQFSRVRVPPPGP